MALSVWQPALLDHILRRGLLHNPASCLEEALPVHRNPETLHVKLTTTFHINLLISFERFTTNHCLFLVLHPILPNDNLIVSLPVRLLNQTVTVNFYVVCY